MYKYSEVTILKITEQEKEAVKAYQGINYKLFNSILEVSMSAQTDFISRSNPEPEIFNRETIQKLIENIKLIYSAMLKYSMNSPKLNRIYRGTSQSDIDRISSRHIINKFLSTTYDLEEAKGFFSLNWDNPAFVGVEVEAGVPYLDMAPFIDDGRDVAEREVLLSPFLKIDSIELVRSEERTTIKGPKVQKTYEVKLKKGELQELSDEDRESLSGEVLDNAEDISKKQQRYFRIIKQLDEVEYFTNKNAEDINKIREKLSSPFLSNREKQELEADLAYLIGERSEELKSTYSRLINEKDLLAQEIESWKEKVVQICMSDCRSVEKDMQHQIAEEKEAREKSIEEAKRAKEARMVERIENTKELHGIVCDGVSKRVNDIGINVKNALRFKRDLEMHSKKMGITYASYIEGLRNLGNCIDRFNDKMESFSHIKQPNIGEDGNIEAAVFESENIRSACEKLERTCNSMGDIPFQELKILEEASFKQGIANKVLDIKLGIYADILKDEIIKIDNIKGLRKFFNKLTGREKANQQRREVLYQSVKKIYEQKKEIMEGINIGNRPSVHKIIADIESLYSEYSNNPQFSKEIGELKNIRSELGQIYKINQNEVNRNLAESRALVERGKEYSRSDLIMLQVNEYASKPREAKKKVGRFNTQHSIEVMSNIMHEAISDKERVRQVDRDVSR